jgi:hypothetical protein
VASVFLSYAREDERQAEQLYMDLRRAEVDVWMDKKCLLPGQNWEHEIRKAIRRAKYFLALVSKSSVGKRGFVQREMRIALDVLDEVPIDQVYLIPVRVDDSEPPDFRVKAINRVDLFPSYRKGLERLLSVIVDIERHPVIALDPKSAISAHAPIEFTPYRSFEGFIRDVLAKLPDSGHFHDREVSYYITYRTGEDGVLIPAYLKEKYPETITIVLRSGYLDLSIEDAAMGVKLLFNGQWESLRIPYSAIDKVEVPEINVLVTRVGAGGV